MMWAILVVMSMLVSTAIPIRVDFNTNTGPIRPPTTTLPPPPQPPFREPAPVWEDQSNDIPNPDPYRYVPPPPSRPRYNNNDIESNNIFNDNEKYNEIKNVKENNARGFFVDVPPKFYKTSLAKQQYYQDKYLNDIFSKNYYNKADKYSIIAFKDKYHGLPYYVFYFARVPSQ
ncbi:uncharacterized protein LOC116338642 isoform X2 [Contarinia nasturtii]|nr:uncharacterized protein LOC116338642 isoform X2 [Contarinia nasturtii]